MAIHTTDAIILRRYPYRETSVIVSCLTAEYGKLKGLVKGLRVSQSRHRSQMEPMTVNRIVFYDTRSSQLHLISQCELLLPFTGLARSVETVRLAARCLDVVDATLPLDEPQPASFQLLKQTLERLEAGSDDPISLELYFTIRFLHLAGFRPQLYECTGCGTHIRLSAYWSGRQGGLLCERCLHEDPHAEAATSEQVSKLEELAEASQPIMLTPSLAKTLRGRLREFLAWHLEKPLRTMTT